MAHILIATEPQDLHAVTVKLALERTGHRVTRWFGADFPSKLCNSIAIDDKGCTWHARGPGLVTEQDEFDIVWLRRPRLPVSPQYHPDDQQKAERENVA